MKGEARGIDKVELPTRPWVPKWLGVVTMFVVLLSVILLNGTYIGSSLDLSGELGTQTEDVMMAFYASTVGMIVGNPMTHKVRKVTTSKTIFLFNLAMQAVFCMICAHTGSMLIITICSFIMGIMKVALTTEFIMIMMWFFSPEKVRSEWYAYFYPMVCGGGQLSMILTAEMAYNYRWQYTYYFVMGLLLVAMVFVILFFRKAERPVEFPFKDVNFRSILTIGVSYMLIIYVLIYGKTLDWFSSPVLRVCAVAAVVLGAAFLVHQRDLKQPYIYLYPLRQWKPLLGYLFMFICMGFSTTTTVVNIYVNNILGLDSIHSNALCLWLLPGFVVGGIISFWWFRLQRWRFRYLIGAAMFCYAIYFGIIYFNIHPEGRYETLFLPMFFRGLAMMILVIAFGVFTAEDMPQKYLISNTFYMVTIRSLIAPVAAYSLYSNLIYRLQMRGMERLCVNMTLTDPTAAAEYAQKLSGAMSGHGYADAVNIATSGLYNELYQQALLLSMKTMFGYLLIAAVVIGVVSCFIPFHKTIRVPIVRAWVDMG